MMIRILARITLFFFKLFAKRRYESFVRSLDDPKAVQMKLYAQLKARYEKSPRYHRTSIKFDELKPHNYNQLVAVGEIAEVCSDKIVCYEETSGSSGIKKKIPYTRALLNSFSSMFIIWAYDILQRIPFESYKFYFSISPQFNESENGLEDDSDYLGILGFFLSPFTVKIPNAKKIKDSDEFLMKLALTLVSNRELEIISIWSPTFLLSLLDFIEAHEAEFKSHLAQGHYKDLKFKAIKDYYGLFPSLKFVSCWGSASANGNFLKLQKRLPPGVRMQRKGLLATEAPMTIPLLGHDGSVPLINEVFFEFINPSGETKYLWELTKGVDYELIISQKGGLYRYPMNDLVCVVGEIGATPLLEFKGRSSQTSDLVGEKLHESEAYEAIKDRAIALIASESNLCYYALGEDLLTESDLLAIEAKLRSNPHYHNARELKQLRPLRALRVDRPSEHIRDYHQKILGIHSGDIKDSALIYRKSDEFLEQLVLLAKPNNL